MAEDGREFGDRLADRRQSAGLSQLELAQRSGISIRTVGNLERGRVHSPHPDTVRRLADGLGLDGHARNEFIAGARRLPGPGTPAPRQLPAGAGQFTGRKAELDFLGRLLDAPHGSPADGGTVVISAIGGTAGVGKTALALHWAHQVAGLFGDGQLYVNLRGFDPSGTPATPAEAIRRFLDALGVPPERVPADPAAQAGLYRSLLADRQMLILLDNARDEAQVRPLLPASPASLVIITSRSLLAGLAAAEGARLLPLDLLTRDEAVQLLTARIGSERTAAEPAAVSEIAALCAHLPLALAVTAAQAAARPGIPLSALADELRDSAGRLDALDPGDPAASVAAVFSWSYQQLTAQAARMFRLLGLHPGPDITAPAAASLAATPQPEARRLLRELSRDCLITEHVPGRYAFHDLLRAYAASQARDHEAKPGHPAASRVLDHYLHTAEHAARLLRPTPDPLALTPPSPGTVPEQPASHREALAWFRAEHHVLLAVAALATGTGADRHAWQLPCAMTYYLNRQCYPHEGAALMGTALAAATRLGDPRGQALCLRNLGNARTNTGDHDQARAYLERCLPMFRQLGDRMGEALARQSLGRLAVLQGRSADALAHAEHALRLHQAAGDEPGQALLLNNIAWCHAQLGDYQQARRSCEQSLAMHARVGRTDLEYNAWDTLGYIELHLGDHARAISHFETALAMCRENGDRHSEAEILTHAGDARHSAGDLPRARHAWQQALDIYDDLRHPDAGPVRARLATAGDPAS